LTIPKGIFHLFFSDGSNKPDYSLGDSLKQTEINDGIHFFLEFSRGHFSLPNDIHVSFLSIFKFHAEVLNSYCAFFSPGFAMANISQKEFEDCQQKLTDMGKRNNIL
jgi:hypothetical protein